MRRVLHSTVPRYSLQWCTLTRPPLVRTHTSNPAFPTGGGWVGRFRFLCCGGDWTSWALGHPLRGGWSHSPPVGKGGDVDDDVLCAGGWVVAVLSVVATPLGVRGGWSHSPPVGKGGDIDDDVTCVRVGGYGGGFWFKWSFYMTSLYWMAGIEIHARTVVRVGM